MAEHSVRASAALEAPLRLDLGTALLVARFLARVVEDTIEVPLPGEEDVYFDCDDLYECFAAFCEETGSQCLSPEEFDRILAEA